MNNFPHRYWGNKIRSTNIVAFFVFVFFSNFISIVDILFKYEAIQCTIHHEFLSDLSTPENSTFPVFSFSAL